MKTILKISDVKGIPNTFDEDDLLKIIEKVERLQVIQMMGKQFYYAVRKTPSDYADLLGEKAYQVNGEDCEHPGLKEMIKELVMAKFVKRGNLMITPQGYAEAAFPELNKVDGKDKRDLVADYLETADQFWLDIQHYLNNNTTTYPLWKCEEVKPPIRRKSVRLTRI